MAVTRLDDTTPLHLVRATDADLPFVMATERLDGYETLVGRSDEARHRAALADPRHAYFVGRLAQRRVGFVIVRGWASDDRVTLIKRIAMTEPCRGHGRHLLRAVIDAIFRETEAHRLWIGLFPDNLRARHVYEAVGFVAEGVARGNVFMGGVNRDELVMAMLRTDWAGGR